MSVPVPGLKVTVDVDSVGQEQMDISQTADQLDEIYCSCSVSELFYAPLHLLLPLVLCCIALA